ncbi:hypothetical protein T484DRAFT_2969230 [Baffinella frigidus]|nr:hypothetical protein T484DRAFT_2969230 [Cryptophyta sp. CCMP2293]
MAEAIITSPRSWKPPETFASTQIMMTATFKGDRTLGTSTFGGSVRGENLGREEKDALRDFIADRFLRTQDEEILRVIMGCRFANDKRAAQLDQAFDPGGKGGSDLRVVSCEELLGLVHKADYRDWLGSREVRRRRVHSLAECCRWKELAQVSMQQLFAAVDLYFEAQQEVLLGRPMLEGHTAMVMVGKEQTSLSPQLLLANERRSEVIDKENALTEELIVSPKAWTRKGQMEIAEIRKGTRVKDAKKKIMEEELASIVKDAEMDVKSVLEDMWNNSDAETKQSYIDEFEALCERYIEARVGQRVRLSSMTQSRNAQRGVMDISLAPGACDAMSKTGTRWFGNRSFTAGNFPDIPAGTLAAEGGMGVVKSVHRDRERVLVAWDRSGKLEWYSTGFQCHYSLAVCDPDAGPGTTHCLDGVTSLRLLTSRIDM